jgi:catechol 2,3-dioxygenase
MSWGVISSMGYISLRSTDVAASVADAQQLLGLRLTHQADGTAYLAAANVHHELSYVPSDVAGVDRIGLVAASGDALLEIKRRVRDAGLAVIAEKPLGAGIAEAFSFVGPEGFVFEIYLGMEQPAPVVVTSGADRYGHINLHPQDVVGMKRFLETILDFRVSDVIGDDFAYFLRCNADHHGIALISGRGTLHHHAWQAQSIVELGKLGDRLHALGRRLIWGPVRHGAGRNIAAYYVEPTGAVVELYTDLEQIYDDDRTPVVWDMEDNWVNLWGVYRGEDFRSHGIGPAARR